MQQAIKLFAACTYIGYRWTSNERGIEVAKRSTKPAAPQLAPQVPAPQSAVVPYDPAIAVEQRVDPRIPGTRVPIYRIAALLDAGMAVDEVAQDFPSLTKAQIRSAQAYAKAHPPARKKYPGISLKRLLRNSGFAELERELRKLKKRS